MFCNKTKFSAFALAVALVSLVVVDRSYGIIVADDPVLHEVQASSPFNMVGLYRGASAVLIDPWHVMTARHLAGGTLAGTTFTMKLPDGTKTFKVAKGFLHSSEDLAVLELAQDTGLPGYDLYTGSSEYGQNAAYLGWGISGVGKPSSLYPKGQKLRVGYNKIDMVTSNHLGTTMDYAGTPNFIGKSLEALPADGDSGGATFLNVNGVYKLIGIHSGVTDNNGDGIYPTWGDQEQDVRVSAYAGWIDNILNNFQAPTPAPITYLAGDCNKDGRVDLADFTTLRANLGMSGATWAKGDFTGDGMVNLQDFTLLRSNLGATMAPEPATMALLACGTIALVVRHRRRS